jgi:hypothetical protein
VRVLACVHAVGTRREYGEDERIENRRTRRRAVLSHRALAADPACPMRTMSAAPLSLYGDDSIRLNRMPDAGHVCF